MDIEQLKKEMIGEFAEIVKVHNDLNPNFNITIPAFEHIESFLLFKFNELEKAAREEIVEEAVKIVGEEYKKQYIGSSERQELREALKKLKALTNLK